MKRTVLALAVVAIAFVILAGSRSTGLAAPPPFFTITSLTCSSNLGHIAVQNVSGALANLGLSAVSITQTNGAITTININNSITPSVPGGYNVNSGITLDLQVGVGATQNPNPAANPITVPQSVVLSTTPLLTPGAEVTLIDSNGAPSNTVDCPLSALARTLIVSTLGYDVIPGTGTPNSVCGPDLNGAPPTTTNPGPCLTIQNALTYARDGDTIDVEAGIYEICLPITISKLVTITNPNWTTQKTILHSFGGDSVFDVTAVGGPGAGTGIVGPVGPTTGVGPTGQSLHASINGLAIGGVTLPGSAAIVLDHDGYTDVTNNVLGGDVLNNPSFTGIPCSQAQPAPGTPPVHSIKAETFANSESIILNSSDHPNISNNDILGSSVFAFVPVLAAGPAVSGFGIVTSECLGQGADVSDAVNISNNLIDKNSNAGIWLCSDGGGLHLIKNNVVRNNGRGIVLRAIADSTIDSNTISNDFQDGIIVYDAANNDTLSNNLIESNRTPGAAGIRIGDFGAGLYPLATTLTGNKLIRNWTGLVIAGARNTNATGNTITSEDPRTGVLIQVGSSGAPSFTQPAGTVLHANQIVANGQCNAVAGCAIRLDLGVTVDVDANPTTLSLPPTIDPNTVLWHKPNDPSLGYINVGQVQPTTTQPTPTTGVGPTGVGPTGPTGNTPGPIATATSPVPLITPTTTPGAGGNGGFTLCTAPNTPPGCIPPPCTNGQMAGCQPTPAMCAGANPPAGCHNPSGVGASSAATATPAAGATTTNALAASSSFASPSLTAGPPGGSTTYTPICSFVTVASGLVSTVGVGQFLSQFQPVQNIASAWRVNNGTHLFEALYFGDAGAPVEAITLRRGDIVSVCISGTVQGPP